MKSFEHPRNRHGHAGFTVLETLLVLAIVSLIALMSVPRYEQFMAQQNVSIVSQQLRDDLELARTYAQTHQTEVRVCPIVPSNLNAEQPACNTNPRNWETWAVVRMDTGQVLSRSSRIPAAISILTGERTAIQFNQRGGANGYNATITVQDTRFANIQETIVIAAVGRIS